MAFKFEKLKVWQRAVDLSGGISDLIRSFPVEERYVLAAQMRLAAVDYRPSTTDLRHTPGELAKAPLLLTMDYRLWTAR